MKQRYTTKTIVERRILFLLVVLLVVVHQLEREQGVNSFVLHQPNTSTSESDVIKRLLSRSSNTRRILRTQFGGGYCNRYHCKLSTGVNEERILFFSASFMKNYDVDNYSPVEDASPMNVPSADIDMINTYLVLWRGEHEKGYSKCFRHLELSHALSSTIGLDEQSPLLFQDALESLDESEDAYGLLQYIQMDINKYKDQDEEVPACSINESTYPYLTSSSLIKAAERSSLVRKVFELVGEGETYQDLAQDVLDNETLHDLMKDGILSTSSWCLRFREFEKGMQVASSVKQEREAIKSMSLLLDKLHGPVNLKRPDVQLYIFHGLEGRKKHVLLKQLAEGPNTNCISPSTRICKTRTPLCPIATYILCNASRMKSDQTILDPYAGSCTTLLASARIVPSSKTVAIEIQDDDRISRNKILRDFSTRDLPPPALIQGDCINSCVRDEARAAIGGEAFDIILADPPYGIREKKHDDMDPPLIGLVKIIAEDLKNGKRLLKPNGRLVVFVPTKNGQDVKDDLPSSDEITNAGLVMTDMVEQKLGNELSRWLVAYTCLK